MLLCSVGSVAYHQSVVVKNKMYLIGGNSLNSDPRIMHRLDLKTNFWETVSVKPAGELPENMPESIDEHTACMASDEDTVYTFGGFVNGQRSNLVHRFTISTNTWELVAPADPKAPTPLPRCGHSAVLYEDKTLMVFGGKNDENEKMNDTWHFDVTDRVWTKLEFDN